MVSVTSTGKALKGRQNEADHGRDTAPVSIVKRSLKQRESLFLGTGKRAEASNRNRTRAGEIFDN